MTAQHDPELTVMFNALAHSYRRYVLYYLTTESEEVRLETLAETLADREDGHPTTERHDAKANIKAELHHMHLPKLVEFGIITFDMDTATIELNETIGHDQLIARSSRIEGYTQPAAGD